MTDGRRTEHDGSDGSETTVAILARHLEYVAVPGGLCLFAPRRSVLIAAAPWYERVARSRIYDPTVPCWLAVVAGDRDEDAWDVRAGVDVVRGVPHWWLALHVTALHGFGGSK